MRPGIVLPALIAGAAVSGCFDTVATPFPPGLEPFESVNGASLPAPIDGDACPETITLARVAPFDGATNVHARACIHAPLTDVFRAIQNPQTTRDPSSSHPPFLVVEPAIADECDGPYQTQVHVDDIVDVDFRICWRHAVIEGTDDAPLVTATRWQKVWGTTIITTLEGSIVARPHPEDPSITVLEIQYHLEALIDDAERLESYLNAIYARLRDDAHGVPLLPADF